MIVGRLAPTPSGALHLGNVLAFAAAWLAARASHGRLLLRIEDVDVIRAKPHLEGGIRHDLAWLGFDWDAETPRQSARDYRGALARLAGRTYRCTCTRKMLRDTGGVYPGTCRDAGHTEGAVRFRLPAHPVVFEDRIHGRQVVDPATIGDPVLVRRDGLEAYALAVVADDVVDGVTEVVRGADLLPHTAVQVCLHEALGHTPPTWMHTPMVLGADDRKLAKSHASSSVADLRDAGWTPEDVWGVVLPWLGLHGTGLADGLDGFSPPRIPAGPFVWDPPSPAPPRPR